MLLCERLLFRLDGIVLHCVVDWIRIRMRGRRRHYHGHREGSWRRVVLSGMLAGYSFDGEWTRKDRRQSTTQNKCENTIYTLSVKTEIARVHRILPALDSLVSL